MATRIRSGRTRLRRALGTGLDAQDGTACAAGQAGLVPRGTGSGAGVLHSLVVGARAGEQRFGDDIGPGGIADGGRMELVAREDIGPAPDPLGDLGGEVGVCRADALRL